MQEMAVVSLNKVRLQYYLSKKFKRAFWINSFLQNPSKLFGTTLLGVNIALQIGSECSRELYTTLQLNPDLSPLTHVFLVLIFAELAPMFAGRKYAEHVCMLGVPILYLSALLLTPITWIIHCISRIMNYFLSKETSQTFFLDKDELQHLLLESQDRGSYSNVRKFEFQTMSFNIFALKEKTARDLMTPIQIARCIPSNATVGQFRESLSHAYSPYLPIYHRSKTNIINIAYPRDLLKASDNKRVRDYARSPWFVIESTTLLQILQQFRRNNESVAIILDKKGSVTGVLSLETILRELFVKTRYAHSYNVTNQRVIEKTFPGNTSIADFNKKYHFNIHSIHSTNLSQLMSEHLGHIPEKDEFVRIGTLELKAEDVCLTGAKTIFVRTLLT